MQSECRFSLSRRNPTYSGTRNFMELWSGYCDEQIAACSSSKTKPKDNVVMRSPKTHPNTRAIIEAWERLSGDVSGTSAIPDDYDYPDLVGRLFIIQRISNDIFVFRTAGTTLTSLFDKDLTDCDFLSLWRFNDRELICAALTASLRERAPTIIETTATTADNLQLMVELSCSPIDPPFIDAPRFLCLYQVTGGSHQKLGKPVHTHFINSIHPPVPRLPVGPDGS